MARMRGNGTGNITKIKGRKSQYRVRVTVGCYYDEETGKMKQELKTLGYFKTKAEAEKALVEYNESPYDLSLKVITFKDLYEKWSDAYFSKLSGDSSIRTITSAYEYCRKLDNMKLKDIGTGHLKDCMETGYVIVKTGKNKGKKRYASDNTKCRMKSMFNLMFDYAYERNLVRDNVARKFKVNEYRHNAEISRKIKEPFTEDEIELIWKYVDEIPFADIVLIGIYTGFRPSELADLRVENVFLDENMIIGGMKTVAGTDRKVPIHPRIKPLVERDIIRQQRDLKVRDYLMMHEGNRGLG